MDDFWLWVMTMYFVQSVVLGPKFEEVLLLTYLFQYFYCWLLPFTILNVDTVDSNPTLHVGGIPQRMILEIWILKRCLDLDSLGTMIHICKRICNILRGCTLISISYFDIFWTPYHMWYPWDIFWRPPYPITMDNDI